MRLAKLKPIIDYIMVASYVARRTSSVFLSSNKSRSLRTTVPEEVVENLNLSKGDKIQWLINFNGPGNVTISVRKMEIEQKAST